MLSKLDVITFRGSGGCVFTVDNFFFAVQVCSPVYRHYKVPAGGVSILNSSEEEFIMRTHEIPEGKSRDF